MVEVSLLTGTPRVVNKQDRNQAVVAVLSINGCTTTVIIMDSPAWFVRNRGIGNTLESLLNVPVFRRENNFQ